MSKKTKGQKLFLLLIIAAICIGAFCMAGCHTSCFGCDVGCNAEDENYSAGIINSCDSCGTENSCGIGAGGYLDDDAVSGGIRFLADSTSKKDANAVYGNASCYTEFDECGGCDLYCGTYNDEDGSNISGIFIEGDDFDVSCGEESGYGPYGMIKAWLSYFFR